jgi:radical SAM protein with 4Fe4S-binding SPASM domain
MNLSQIRSITRARLFNLLKLYSSFWVSLFVKKPIRWGMPTAISVEPANTCNLSCPECPVGSKTIKRRSPIMEPETYQILLHQLHKYLFTINFYFQGEPFLSPYLFEMISRAREKGILTIASTNGHFLSTEIAEKTVQSGLNKLIVSLDGLTPETYSAYRQKGNLGKVIDGIKNIARAKAKLKSKSPEIIIQFLVFKSNQHEMELAKKVAKNLGANRLVFKSVQIYNFEKAELLIPDLDKYSRYRKTKDGTFAIKSKLKNRCWRMWSNPVITASGDLAVCCFDKNAHFHIGNINHKPFSEIWQSQAYKQFMKRVLTNRKEIGICTNCTEGLKRVLH